MRELLVSRAGNKPGRIASRSWKFCCFILLSFVLSTLTYAQIPAQCGSPGCNSNDVRITKAKISDEVGNFFVCAGTEYVSGAWLHLFVTTNTKRVGCFVSLTVNVVTGTDTVRTNIPYCFSNISLNGADNDLKVLLPNNLFRCGSEVFLTNIFTAWGTGTSDFCGGSNGIVCQGTPSKCRFVIGEIISVQTNPCAVPTSVIVAPSSDTKCVGGNSSFTVSFGNNQAATIQWEVSTNSGSSWAILAGQTSSTLNLTGVTATMDGNLYHAVVTNHTSDPLGTHECPATSSSATLTVKTAPTTSNAGDLQNICTNGSATLAANSPSVGTGAWSVFSGPSTSSAQFSSTTSNTATFTPAGGAGSYVLRWTISNSPCTASSSDVTITVKALPTTAAAGDPQTICTTGSAVLGANNPPVGTGAWSVFSGPSTSASQFSNTSSNTATFTPAGGAGSYVLRWTISNSPCTQSTSDVTITVKAVPTTSNAGDPQTICSTGSATLAANDPAVGTGAWSVFSGPSTSASQFNNTSSNTATFTPAGGAGSYVLRWTISNSPCTASTSNVTITVKGVPTTSNAGGPQTICTTGSATLAANNPGVGTGSWSVVSGPSTLASQFSNASSNTAIFTPASGNGTYTLRWTISNSPCTASTSDVAITVNAIPSSPDVTYLYPTCTQTTFGVRVNSPTAGVMYTIKDKNGATIAGVLPSSSVTPANSNSFDFTNIPNGIGYQVTASVAGGCNSAANSCGTPNPVAGRASTDQPENVAASQTTVTAYPNPFSDKLKFIVTTAESGKGSLEVYNMMGQKVKTVYAGFITTGTQTFELSLPSYQIANLVYVLRIGNKKISGKLLQINR